MHVANEVLSDGDDTVITMAAGVDRHRLGTNGVAVGLVDIQLPGDSPAAELSRLMPAQHLALAVLGPDPQVIAETAAREDRLAFISHLHG